MLKCSEAGLGTRVGTQHSNGRAGKLLRWLLAGVPAADVQWSKELREPGTRGPGKGDKACKHEWVILNRAGRDALVEAAQRVTDLSEFNSQLRRAECTAVVRARLLRQGHHECPTCHSPLNGITATAEAVGTGCAMCEG